MNNWISVKEKLPPCNVLVKVRLTNGIETLDFVNEPIDNNTPFQHYHVLEWKKPSRDELNDFMKECIKIKKKRRTKQ